MPITAAYNVDTFAFVTEANCDTFRVNPAMVVPQIDGHCAYGVAKGGKVPDTPKLWRIVDAKRYLNITRNVAGVWEKDIPGGLEAAAALADKIAGFASQVPVS